jgi:hypothetical protein
VDKRVKQDVKQDKVDVIPDVADVTPDVADVTPDVADVKKHSPVCLHPGLGVTPGCGGCHSGCRGCHIQQHPEIKHTPALF